MCMLHHFAIMLCSLSEFVIESTNSLRNEAIEFCMSESLNHSSDSFKH